MRVLVLSSTYPPHALGGYEQSCHDVVRRWRTSGHDVEVLASDLRLPGVADVPEPAVHRDLRWYWDDHVLLDPPLQQTIAIERWDQQRLGEALAAGPDIVSVWAMGAMPMQLVTALVESEVPVVLVVCDDWLDYGPRVDPWSRRFLRSRLKAAVVRRLVDLPTRLPDDLGARVTAVFVSERTRQHALDRSPWTFPGSCVIPSGIDLADFPLSVPVERPWRGRLLCVGRVEPRKGFRTAIEALPQGMSLSVVGPAAPDHLRELTALAAGGDVHFSVARRSQLRDVYADHDALLFTSAWEEPFGLVPLEAMACGTPVVAVASGGAADYLEHEGNCLVVPAGDATALRAAVTRLAADPGLRAALRAGGLQTAGRYTTDRLAIELEKVHLAAVGA